MEITLNLIFGIPLAVGAFYLVAVIYCGRLSKVKCETVNDDIDGKFAVIIPAHNERDLIASTLKSINKAAKESSKVSTYVIADNCDDETALIARRMGAIVWERTSVHKGKGAALDDFLKKFRNQLITVDFITIVDADTIVEEEFFTETLNAFCSSSFDVLQGYYGVLNRNKNRRLELSGIMLNLAHNFRQRARINMGGNAGLKGNGMVFRRSVLDQMGWPAHSLVEDLELSISLVKSGYRIGYSNAVKVHAEMPSQEKDFFRQRLRWEGGRYQVLKKELPSLLSFAFRKRSWAALEVVSDLIFPPVGLWLSFCLSALVAGILAPFLFVGGAIGIILIVILIFCSQRAVRESLKIQLLLIEAPQFFVSKLKLYLSIAMTSKSLTWQRTRRESEI